MAYKVYWSQEAEDSFYIVIDELLFRWPPKIAEDFIDHTEKLIDQITIFPYLFRAYKNKTNVRHGIVHKNVTMFYKIDKEQKMIKILLFWATRTNPAKLKLEE